IALPSNLVIEATGPNGAAASYTATAVDSVSGSLPVNYNVAPGMVFPVGTTEVTVLATDNAGNVGVGTFTVTVRDTTAPVFQSLSASPSVIAKPNGKMTPVVITANVADAVDTTPTTRIVSVTSNEGTSADWQVTGDLTLNVRAERNNKGTGRVYTVTVESRDDAGNASTRNVTVTVPR
ncbi:MAG TPA: HYR domain-containing protein, partial [Pyrinomonadaceae bacterium]|nr:HYR domain-containing protein [Pyrinomonadaceae bacterium]